MRLFYFLALCISLLFVLAACGEDDQQEPIETPSLVRLDVESTDTAVIATVNATATFFAIATFSNGATQEVTQAAQFDYAYDETISYTQNAHAQLTLSATAHGSLHVTAQYGGLSATKHITIEPGVMYVTLSPQGGNAAPTLGPTLTFMAIAVLNDSTTEDVTSATTFTYVADEGVVYTTIANHQLRVSDAASGNVHVTAHYETEKYGDFTASATIAILATQATITGLHIYDVPSELEHEQGVQLRGEASLSDGGILSNVAGATWTPSDTNSISVSNDGYVFAHASTGSATITFAYGGLAVSRVIQVVPTMTQLQFSQEAYWVTTNGSKIMANKDLIATYSNGATEAVLHDATLSGFNPALVNIAVDEFNNHYLVAGVQRGTTAISAQLTKRAKTLTQAIPVYVQEAIELVVTITLDGGRPTTALQQVGYIVSMPASHLVTHALVADTLGSTPSVDDAGWQAVYDGSLAGTHTFSVAGTNGYVARVLYAWGMNQFGAISSAASDTILQTDPIVSQANAGGSNPLMHQQWHLINRGQTGFAQRVGIASGHNGQAPYSDSNLLDVWQIYGIKGHDVVVNVVDTGLDIAHEDFMLVDESRSENYRDGLGGSRDPSPIGTTGDHGTSVAGIVAMGEGNNIGGIGVAPSVTLVGHNLLQSVTAAHMSNALLQAHVDVVNMSFGYDVTNLSAGNQGNSYADFFLAGREQRDGHGIIYIKSAGNGFISYGSASCSSASNYNISCQNPSHDDMNNNINVIVVAAVNANGAKSSYSAAGPNVWISGFGGEYGVDISQTNYSTTAPYIEPAIITTDVSGCQAGYSKQFSSDKSGIELATEYINSIGSAFNFGFAEPASGTTAHPENSQCNYTNTFNGTSSAAPTIAGVVALLLQANPNLSWREVKDILARAGRMPQHTQTTLSGYILNQGVITNAAGYQFDNWYGFGVVDVDAAVKLALEYPTHAFGELQQATATNGFDMTIPDSNPDGASTEVTIGASLTIEAVQIVVDITHSRSSDVALYLTSPSGTMHQITNHFHGVSTSYNNVALTSNAFYGETSQGTWSLRVVDASSTQTGIVRNWQLRVFGH